MSAINTSTTTTTSNTVVNTNTTAAPTRMDQAKSQLNSFANHTKSSISSLKSHPSSVRCSQCAADMAIPPSVWSWSCVNNHTNSIDVSQCATCNQQKPTGVTWPAMLCSHCGAITSVPGSEGSAVFHDAGLSIKSGIHQLIDRPKTFHCVCCNTSLIAPAGPWNCQSCRAMNEESNQSCARCNQSKLHQRVLCAHCKKSTTIPANGLSDSIASGLSAFTAMAKKGLLDLTGKPNVQCPICSHAVELPKVIATNSHPVAATTHSTNTASVAGLPAATAHGTPINDHPISLTCTNCSHHFTLGSQTSTVTRPSVGDNIPIPGGDSVLDMPVAVVAPDQSLTSAIGSNK